MKAKYINSTIGFFLIHGKAGDTFYTDKSDRHVSAMACYRARKVKTERVIVVGGDRDRPRARAAVKITIVK